MSDTIADENKFRIKTGYCHLTPDRILFSRNGKLKQDSPARKRLRWWLPVLDFLLIFTLLFAGLYLATIHKTTLAIILAVAAIYRIVKMITSLIRSKITEIDRQELLRVRMNPGIKGISRARVRFIFKMPNGKKRRKLIILPDAEDSGHAETDRACKILRDEGLVY